MQTTPRAEIAEGLGRWPEGGGRGAVQAARRPWLSATALALFPLLLIDLILWGLVDPEIYRYSLMEDGPLEYATFGCLLLAALMALGAALRATRRSGRGGRFYWVVSLFGLLVALEEISWGQRLLGIASPAFFLRYSTQEEVNAHNVFQKWTGIKSKHLAGGWMLFYGVALPAMRARSRLRAAFERRAIPIPPRFLVPGFALGAGAMIDLPTGREEEIGECFFAICLLLFMAFEYLELGGARAASHAGQGDGARGQGFFAAADPPDGRSRFQATT
jgi:hypothetical protein